MGLTESITIFNKREISKNASIVLGTPIPLERFGPNDKFYPDISASGGGDVKIYYKVGTSPDGTFLKPGTASYMGIQKSTLGSGASRDIFPAVSPIMAPWMTFKAVELNASPVVMSFNLIVVKE